MKDKGYEQAVQNIAYRIFLEAEDSVNMDETPEQFLKNVLSDPKRATVWIQLDNIAEATANIYDIPLKEVRDDVLKELRELIMKHIQNIFNS